MEAAILLVSFLVVGPRVCLAALPSPTNVKGTLSTSGGVFNITWKYSSSSVDGFYIYMNGRPTSPIQYRSDSELQWAELSTTMGSAVSAYVTAYLGSAESPPSAEMQLLALPITPHDVTVSSPSTGVALVKWTHPGDSTSGFYIRVSSSTGQMNVTGLIPPPADILQPLERNISLTVGQTYNISVINQYEGWDSPDSNPVVFVARPSIPVSVSAEVMDQASGTFELRWLHGGGPVDTFVVRYQVDGGSISERVVHPSGNLSELQQAEFTAKPGRPMKFWVISQTNGINSAESLGVEGVLKPITPSAVEVTTGTGPGDAVVSWLPGYGGIDNFVISGNPPFPNGDISVPAQADQSSRQQVTITTTVGTTYMITIRAEKSNVFSNATEPVQFVSTLQPPSDVKGTQSASGGVFNITWKYSSYSVDGFYIFMNGRPTSPIQYRSDSELQWAELSTTMGSTVSAYVTAYLGSAESPPSAEMQLLALPITPHDVTVTSPSTGVALVKWTHPGDSTSGFYIRVSSSTGLMNVTDLIPPPADILQPLEQNISLTVGQTYNISVINQYQGWDSPDSNPVLFVVRPSIPVSVSAEVMDQASGKFELRWRHGGGPVDTFVVRYQVDGGSISKRVVDPSGNLSELQQAEFTAKPGRPMKFWVISQTNGINSAESLGVEGVLKPITPSAVEVTTGTGPGDAVVSWLPGFGGIDNFVISGNPPFPNGDISLPAQADQSSRQQVTITTTVGTTYMITIRAEKSNVFSNATEPVQFDSTLQPPSDVKGTQSASGGVFNITWKYSSYSVDGFYIYMNGRPTSPIQYRSDSELQWAELSTTMGSTVSAYVTAYLGSTESPPSAEMQLLALPITPHDVTVTSPSTGVALVKWTHPGDSTSGFYIRVSSTGLMNVTALIPPPADILQPLEQNISLTVGQTYNISVINQYEGWDSPDSNPVLFVVKPSIPVSLSIVVTDQASGKFDLLWLHNGGSVDKFVIRSQVDGGSISETVVNPSANLTELQRAGFSGQPGRPITFWVMSQTNGINSDESETAQAVLKPSSPQSLKLTTTVYDTMSITWKHGGGPVDSFQITITDNIDNKYQPIVFTSDDYTQILQQTISVTPGVVYNVSVTAVKNGISGETQTLTHTATPSVPVEVELKPSIGYKTVHVTWRSGGGPVDFFVLKVDPPVTEANITAVTDDGHLYSADVEVPETVGEVYVITVQAVKSTVWSETTSGDTFLTTPSEPTSLSSSFVDYNNISISWKHGGGPVDYFGIFTEVIDTPGEDTTVNYTAQNYEGIQRTYLAVVPGKSYRITLECFAQASGSSSKFYNSLPIFANYEAPLAVPKLEELSESQTGTMRIMWSQDSGLFDNFRINIETDDKSVTKQMDISAVPPTSGPYKGDHSITVLPGYKYSVTITAEYGAMLSDPSESLVHVTVPSVPGSVEVIGGSEIGKAELSWQPGDGGVENFIINTMPIIPGTSGDVTVLSSQNSYIFDTEVGKSYNFSVKAVVANVSSPLSTVVTFDSNPSVPNLLEVASVSYDNISISWKHGGGPVDSFKITITDDKGTDIPQMSYTTSGVSGDFSGTLVQYFTVTTGYTYRVTVTTVKGSLYADSETMEIIARPSAPVSVQVTSVSKDKMAVTWRHGTGPRDRYLVEVQTGSELDGHLTDSGEEEAMNITVKAGLDYTVSVLAIYSNVTSLNSDSITVRAPIECYTCEGSLSSCGQIRAVTDHKQLCGSDEVCWIHRDVSNGLVTFRRGCESTACSNNFQSLLGDIVIQGGTITRSKCCTGDACNTGVLNKARTTIVELPLLIASLFITVSTLSAIV